MYNIGKKRYTVGNKRCTKIINTFSKRSTRNYQLITISNYLIHKITIS